MSFINPQFNGLPEDVYRAEPGWSISQLKLLPRYPELFHGLHVAEPRRWIMPETPAMKFGTMVHARVLEPDTFAKSYPVPQLCGAEYKSGERKGLPCEHEGSYRTAADDWYCGFHAKETGAKPVDCISSEDNSRLNSIVRSIQSQPQIRNLLCGEGESELSIFAEDSETGLPIKGRLDKVRGRLIGDLKVLAVDVDGERDISLKMLAMGYHRQAAFYWDLAEALWGGPPAGFCFVCCQPKPPHVCRLWIPGQRELDLGRRQNRAALDDLSARLTDEDWTATRHDELNYFSYPEYAFEDAGRFEEFTGFEE